MSTAMREERLNDAFAALANPTRRAMLAQLALGEASVSELAHPFAMSMPAISRHIKVLERAGLIVQGQRAQYRPCTIDASPLHEIADWTEQYRPIWEERFDQMDGYLENLQRGEPTKNKQTKEKDPKNNE